MKERRKKIGDRVKRNEISLTIMKEEWENKSYKNIFYLTWLFRSLIMTQWDRNYTAGNGQCALKLHHFNKKKIG